MATAETNIAERQPETYRTHDEVAPRWVREKGVVQSNSSQSSCAWGVIDPRLSRMNLKAFQGALVFVGGNILQKGNPSVVVDT